VRFLAASPPADQVVTGVLGFLIVAGMGVALFFLLRSMNKQLRKVAAGPRWREGVGKPQASPADQTGSDEPAEGAAGRVDPAPADKNFQQNGTRLP
jgi:hypothetical protein